MTKEKNKQAKDIDLRKTIKLCNTYMLTLQFTQNINTIIHVLSHKGQHNIGTSERVDSTSSQHYSAIFHKIK